MTGAPRGETINQQFEKNFRQLYRQNKVMMDQRFFRAIVNEAVRTYAAAVVREHPPAVRSNIALSPRELDVLKLISAGLDNAEIGTKLFISENTVKVHVRRLFTRLHARNRAHAVTLGFCLNLINPDDFLNVVAED